MIAVWRTTVFRSIAPPEHESPKPGCQAESHKNAVLCPPRWLCSHRDIRGVAQPNLEAKRLCVMGHVSCYTDARHAKSAILRTSGSRSLPGLIGSARRPPRLQ